MFKKSIKFLVFFILFASTNFSAFAYTEGWEILDFHSDIFMNEFGSIKMREKIHADFSKENHKGILRTIPYEYDNGGLLKYDTRMRFVSATDSRLNEWNTKIYKKNGEFNIEMRTLNDSEIKSAATFIVNYIVDNAINYFDEKDATEQNITPSEEFYWNVNGTSWPVAMRKVSASIYLPKEIPARKINIECFTGEIGAERKDCEWKVVDNKVIEFTTTKPLKAYENLTILVGLPAGTFIPPSFIQEVCVDIFEAFTQNWGLLAGLIVFLIMYMLWKKFGRDDQTVKDTVMPHYKAPAGITPTETGTLIDEKIDPRDITATIIDYAVKGYIKISEIENKKLFGKEIDYELELIKPYKADKQFEAIILKAIFKNNKAGEKIGLSDLKDSFFVNISKIHTSVMHQLIADGYFPHNPKTIRTVYIGVAIVVAVLSMDSVGDFSILTTFGLLIAAASIGFFGYNMPRKTKKGTELYYELLGLYEYIDTAEKDRMQFQEGANIMFEKLLPYAMAFGIVKKWSAAFDGLIFVQPTWYNAKRPWGNGGFNMMYFSGRLDSLGKKITEGVVSKPGGKSSGAWGHSSGFSSGGGFSGGGFGGGGGRGL